MEIRLRGETAKLPVRRGDIEILYEIDERARCVVGEEILLARCTRARIEHGLTLRVDRDACEIGVGHNL